MTQGFSGFINEIIIDAWQKRFGVFSHGGRIADGVQRGKIEKGIPMIEQWRGGDNLVGMAVHEKAEVAEMPVNIVNQCIEDNHVIERLDIFFAKFFIVFMCCVAEAGILTQKVFVSQIGDILLRILTVAIMAFASL